MREFAKTHIDITAELREACPLPVAEGICKFIRVRANILARDAVSGKKTPQEISTSIKHFTSRVNQHCTGEVFSLPGEDALVCMTDPDMQLRMRPINIEHVEEY